MNIKIQMLAGKEAKAFLIWFYNSQLSIKPAFYKKKFHSIFMILGEVVAPKCTTTSSSSKKLDEDGLLCYV